jgi:paraquat-inducible protein A
MVSEAWFAPEDSASMNKIIPLALFTATLALGIGLTTPLMTVDRLYFFSQEPSLVAVIVSLWKGGEVLLALIVAAFSVVFPVTKLALMHLAVAQGRYAVSGTHRLLGHLSRWSMLDVLLVALVIFAAKTSGLAEVMTKPGLWFFAASALLSAAVSAVVLHGGGSRRPEGRA